jgi:hypothetical protein
MLRRTPAACRTLVSRTHRLIVPLVCNVFERVKAIADHPSQRRGAVQEQRLRRVARRREEHKVFRVDPRPDENPLRQDTHGGWDPARVRHSPGRLAILNLTSGSSEAVNSRNVWF